MQNLNCNWNNKHLLATWPFILDAELLLVIEILLTLSWVLSTPEGLVIFEKSCIISTPPPAVVTVMDDVPLEYDDDDVKIAVVPADVATLPPPPAVWLSVNALSLVEENCCCCCCCILGTPPTLLLPLLPVCVWPTALRLLLLAEQDKSSFLGRFSGVLATVSTKKKKKKKR